MNIYALKGHKVKFTGQNGYDLEREYAKKILKVGGIYTVDHTEVGQSSTSVYLEGVDIEPYEGKKRAQSFNSVMFEDAEIQSEDRDKLHVDYKMWNQSIKR